MKGKYIVLLRGSDAYGDKRLEALLFSETLTHLEVASMAGLNKVVSAGFFSITVDEIIPQGDAIPTINLGAKAYGQSDSIGIGGQDFDEFYVERALGLDRNGPLLDRKRRIEDFEKAEQIIANRQNG